MRAPRLDWARRKRSRPTFERAQMKREPADFSMEPLKRERFAAGRPSAQGHRRRASLPASLPATCFRPIAFRFGSSCEPRVASWKSISAISCQQRRLLGKTPTPQLNTMPGSRGRPSGSANKAGASTSTTTISTATRPAPASTLGARLSQLRRLQLVAGGGRACAAARAPLCDRRR